MKPAPHAAGHLYQCPLTKLDLMTLEAEDITRSRVFAGEPEP